MAAMTTRERITRMYEHKEADRIPIMDYPWPTTVERWHEEGLPEGVAFSDYFDIDHFYSIETDNSPRYQERIVEETDEYVTRFTRWGTTERNWKHHGSTPEHLGFLVKDAETWAKAKARMVPSRDRVDWDALKKNFPLWRKSGAWIPAVFWFGFDVTHSHFIGTERMLMAMATEPEWPVDMFNHFLDVEIALYDMVWDAGYHFDEVFWYDDMGYKGTQFFSLDMYRNLLKPVHKRAVEWAGAHGIRTRLHSCGNISTFIPDLIEIGVEMLNPIEVKSGLDPVALKKEYGDKLGLHGGLNAVLYGHPEKLWQEMRRVIPEMKKSGGYICSSDHSVPENVSLADFGHFCELAKELGSYE